MHHRSQCWKCKLAPRFGSSLKQCISYALLTGCMTTLSRTRPTYAFLIDQVISLLVAIF